jgi:monovalent cation:H+ antiporter, CPA1 family
MRTCAIVSRRLNSHGIVGSAKMDLSVGTIEFLLLVAAIVAMLARRFRLPYSVGLVVAGVFLSLLQVLPQIQFSRQLIFTILLPPLIFEAALHISWEELRKEYLTILVMATVGVLLSASITTVGLHYVVNWEWPSALLFSVLIAATDPVSVIAMFKEAGTRGRLRFLTEGESLFNDGTAAVAFTVAVDFVLGRNITPVEVVKTSLLTIGGGILCGVALAVTVLLLAGRTDDHLVEITLSTVGAYGSFLLAEHFQFSGVLATLTAGLILGNVGPPGALSPKGKDAIESFWEYAAFVANSFIFLLIGMNGTKLNFPQVWRSAIVAIALVMVGRAAAVYLTLLPFSRSSSRVSLRHQHVLFWGGLRGALALALALGLPANVPRREEIIIVAFTVVAFSVFIQGITVVPLLRRLGELPAHPRKR